MSIEINLNDHVANITFNEKQDVFSVETSSQLSAVVEELEMFSRVDVVILEHAENAGGKWAALNSVQSSTNERYVEIRELSAGIQAIAALRQPVIATCAGDLQGPGMELYLAADIRFAESNSTFRMSEAAEDRLPMSGAGQRLVRAVGRAQALRMLLLGSPMDVEEAFRIGLISSSSNTSLAEAQLAGEEIASRGPLAVRTFKEALHKGAEMTLEQALQYELDLTILLQSTEDRKEGVDAFLEKRNPDFKAR